MIIPKEKPEEAKENCPLIEIPIEKPAEQRNESDEFKEEEILIQKKYDITRKSKEEIKMLLKDYFPAQHQAKVKEEDEEEAILTNL